MTSKRVIGSCGVMPWHLPADLRWFRENTTGKPVIMGYRTWLCIGQRALPNRRNIVLSRQTGLCLPDAEVVNHPLVALDLVAKTDEAMIIGGGEIYQYFLPYSQRLYLTLIHTDFIGDTYFPHYEMKEWQTSLRIDCAAVTPDKPACSFLILDQIP